MPEPNTYNPYQSPVHVANAGIVLPERSPQLLRTRLGLRLVLSGCWALGIFGLIGILGRVVFSVPEQSGVFYTLLSLFDVIEWCCATLTLLLFAAGMVCCLSVPSETGAKTWAVGAALAGLITTLVGIVPALYFHGIVFSPFLTMILGLSSGLMFGRFVTVLANSLGRRDLSRRGVLIYSAAMATILIFVGFVIALNGAPTPTFLSLTPVVLIASGAALVICGILFTHLMSVLSGEILARQQRHEFETAPAPITISDDAVTLQTPQHDEQHDRHGADEQH